MLGVLITSKVRRKVVTVFAKYPDFRTHPRALAKLIKEDAGNVSRELRRLHAAGFLISAQEGKTIKYQMNKEFPLLTELQRMVIKTQEISPKKKVS